MLNYDGGCLNEDQLDKYGDFMTFSDAEGYSREDNFRIQKHLSRCWDCRDKQAQVIREWKEKRPIR